MTLFIGDVLGGPELGATAGVSVLRDIRRAALELRGQGRELSEQGSLDLVFHFPGTVFQPDFAGVRTAKFSRKRQLLMVQVAVPPAVIQVGEHGFFFDSMKTAVELADPVFARASIPFRADEYLRFIRDTERLIDNAGAALVR